MTELEAIDRLKTDIFRHADFTDNPNEDEFWQAFDMAIDALRKRIPMKMPGTYTDYKCAVCGRRIRSGKGSSSFQRDNFCQRCGQAIDWSE